MQGPRTMPTAHRVIQGIEALHMIRKAQLLGSPENESGNDLDRLCSLIEDRLIRSEWLEPLSFIARPVCNTSICRNAVLSRRRFATMPCEIVSSRSKPRIQTRRWVCEISESESR